MNFDKTTTAETPLIRIVDDEERMRESLAFMLKHEGFECCVYPTAESFLKGDTPSLGRDVCCSMFRWTA
ncbi:hypothetical protein [Sutterella wadsworthensis]|uniref:hypothetical protein n=1 Tax=Sutterella wadsworthensis TaxID=40545 RepID=UPI001F0E0413|nr:hypothetical protein [Sutterella wadsworthensis]